MKTFRYLAAGSLVALSSVAGAQQTTAPIVPTTPTPQAVQQVTFQQAIDIALKQNVAILQAENNVETSRLTVTQASNTWQPTLSFSVNGSNTMGQQFDVQTGQLVTKQSQSIGAGASSGITLFDPNRGLDVAAARLDVASNESNLFRSRQTTVYNVATQFVAYLGAKSQLDVQNENLASLQLQESQIQRFADAGARPISDLYTIKAQVATAQLQVVNAEAQIEAAKFALMRTLQLDASKDYDFVKPDLPSSAATVNYNLDSLTQLAYLQRRDYQAAQEQVTSAQKRVSSAARGYWPSLSFNVNYGSSGRFLPGQTTSFSDQFNNNRGGQISTGLNFPIFDRSNIRIQKTRAQIQQENAELNLASTRQSVALDVRTAWYNIRSAQSRLAAAQAGLISATQALEATQQRYNVGAATLLEVSQARTQRVTAQSNLADAQYNLVVNQAAMAYFTGELDPARLSLGIPR
jgi:outer membrane protein